MSGEILGGIEGLAPPSPDARLAKLEAQQAEILAALRAQPQGPRVSSATGEMMAVMNWAEQNRRSAIEDFAKTLEVVNKIQSGQPIKSEPQDAGGDFVGAIASELVKALAPVLIAKFAPGVAAAPGIPQAPPAIAAPPALPEAPAAPPAPVAPPELPKPPQEEPKG